MPWTVLSSTGAVIGDIDMIDISIPTVPRRVGLFSPGVPFSRLALDGGWMYLAGGPEYGVSMMIFPTQCQPSPEPLGSFSLAQPLENDSLHTTKPELRWHPAQTLDPEDEVGYVAYWSRNPDFSIADSISAGADTSITVGPEALEIQADYFWRVRAWDIRGQTRWSDPPAGRSFFVVDNSETPCMISPSVAAREDGIVITWSVLEATGVNGFLIYRRVPPGEWQVVSPFIYPSGGDYRFLDTDVDAGVRYEYSIEAFGPQGSLGRSAPVSGEMPLPTKLDLRVRPNPGTSVMDLALSMPRAGRVLIRVFDVQGRDVARTTLTDLPAGVHHTVWVPREDGGHPLASGSYFVRAETRWGNRTVRWIVVR